jgi:hypothetical protein
MFFTRTFSDSGRQCSAAPSVKGIMKPEHGIRIQLALDFDAWQTDRTGAAQSEVVQQEIDCPGYDLGHPWHYLACGCGGTPIPVEHIPSPPPSPHDAPLKLPTNPVKRTAKLRAIYQDEQRCLVKCKARYEEIVANGVDALSWYDREIAYGGDLELAWAGSIALAYNHVVSCQGRLAWLRRELGLDPLG